MPAQQQCCVVRLPFHFAGVLRCQPWRGHARRAPTKANSAGCVSAMWPCGHVDVSARTAPGPEHERTRAMRSERKTRAAPRGVGTHWAPQARAQVDERRCHGAFQLTTY